MFRNFHCTVFPVDKLGLKVMYFLPELYFPNLRNAGKVFGKLDKMLLNLDFELVPPQGDVIVARNIIFVCYKQFGLLLRRLGILAASY